MNMSESNKPLTHKEKVDWYLREFYETGMEREAVEKLISENLEYIEWIDGKHRVPQTRQGLLEIEDLHIGMMIWYDGGQYKLMGIYPPSPQPKEELSNEWLVELFEGASSFITTFKSLDEL